MSIAVISGSLRANSFNSAISRKIVELGSSKDRTVYHIDISDVPLFNQDLENAYTGYVYPPNIHNIRDIVAHCSSIIFVTPEHNSMPSAATKNIIDWLSRGGKESVLRNKIIYLVSGAGVGKGSLAQKFLWEGLENMNLYQKLNMTLMKDKSIGVNIFNGETYISENSIIHQGLISELETKLFQ